MRIALSAIALVVVLSSQGCIATAAGTAQDVEFTSEPAGAIVTFGNEKGVTPCTFHVRRSPTPRTAAFSLEGREPVQVEVTSSERVLGAWVVPLAIVDVIFLVPMIVDLALYDRIWFEWPVAVHATLAAPGHPSSITVHRLHDAEPAAPRPRPPS